MAMTRLLVSGLRATLLTACGGSGGGGGGGGNSGPAVLNPTEANTPGAALPSGAVPNAHGLFADANGRLPTTADVIAFHDKKFDSGSHPKSLRTRMHS